MNETDKQKIKEVLASQKLTVISTTGEAAPESALVAFVKDDELNIYFQTNRHSRKAQNLRMKSGVAFVFGLVQDDMVTVQYEGIATPLIELADIEALKARFIAEDSPTTEKYFNDPTAIFFKVRPTWIGCSDYRGEKPEVIELVFEG